VTILHSVGTLDVAATFFAEQKNLAAGEVQTPGYAIVDVDVVIVPFTIDGVSLTLRSGVQNIFNKLYQDHLSTLRGLIVFEPGRNFYLSTTIAI
jgi:outer membrane receptor protein involved in Fe transport